MSGGSGVLDVENRVELAAIERLKGFTDVIGLLKNGAASITSRRDARVAASYPSVYVEAYNMAEFGRHTGNYLGGLRFGCATYKDDDQGFAVSKQVLGALRMFLQQVDIVSLFNGTASAIAFPTQIWFFAVELDMFSTGGPAAYIQDFEMLTKRIQESVIEVAIVVAPSRP